MKKCQQCGKEEVAYEVVCYREDYVARFCSRVCLIDGLVPEIKKAIVPRQWIPTPEEEERMMQ
jgi:hypothetical protein